MKILFSVGELEYNLNANTKIISELAKQMALSGHTVQIVGTCNTSHPDVITEDGVEFKRLYSPKFILKCSDEFEKFIIHTGLSRTQARKKFIISHPISSVGLFIRYNKFYVDKIDSKIFVDKLKRQVKEFNPDAIICVCKPVNKFELAMLAGFNIPLYVYQLDPWGLHRIDNPENSPFVIERELHTFEKSNHIFTTPILLKQYSHLSEYSPQIPKMTELEFPNVINKTLSSTIKSAIDFDDNYINILFSGIVTDEFRSPASILHQLENLLDKKLIRVYFMGTSYSDSLHSYLIKYPEQVIFHNHVDVDTALATMKKADILLNISNAVDNLVPSKIFDYFALGKPVINVQKIENCPSRTYFDRYPLAFTFEEYKDAATANELQAFIHNSKGKSMDFEEISSIFRTATPEYVSNKILQVISDTKED